MTPFSRSDPQRETIELQTTDCNDTGIDQMHLVWDRFSAETVCLSGVDAIMVQVRSLWVQPPTLSRIDSSDSAGKSNCGVHREDSELWTPPSRGSQEETHEDYSKDSTANK